MKLSIAIITYNQVEYIEEALKSILMQQTEYMYEVIVADDGSTDGTRDILVQYAEKYPEIIRPILREKNLGMKNNAIETLKACQGEYIAYLEGDDYWTDPCKIQKQVTFLENHLEYVAVYHGVTKLDQYGKSVTFDITYVEHEEYTIQDLEKFLIPNQTSTVVARNILKNNPHIINVLQKVRYTPLDRILPIILLNKGRIHCFQEEMSVYRYITDSGTSWSSKFGKGDYLWRIVGFLTHREVEKVAKKLDMKVSYRELDVEIYVANILRVNLKKDIRYAFLSLFMLIVGKHRCYIFYNGNKKLMRKIYLRLSGKKQDYI